MEITLQAPAKSVFKEMQKRPGSFLRKHKKSLNNTREYFRLMTSDYSPVKNYPYWKVKELFWKEYIYVTTEGEYKLKDGLEIIDKRKKKIISDPNPERSVATEAQ